MLTPSAASTTERLDGGMGGALIIAVRRAPADVHQDLIRSVQAALRDQPLFPKSILSFRLNVPLAEYANELPGTVELHAH